MALSRFIEIDETIGKNTSKSGIVLDHMQFASRLKDQPPVGDAFTRFAGWEDSLEVTQPIVPNFDSLYLCYIDCICKEFCEIKSINYDLK